MIELRTRSGHCRFMDFVAASQIFFYSKQGYPSDLSLNSKGVTMCHCVVSNSNMLGGIGRVVN